MFFSLIIGTLNRSKELKICLDSLKKQSFKSFEIIIIDQSSDASTEKLITEELYNNLKILYRKVHFKGLSKARNVALQIASGDYFALIDDDAAYKEDYLEIAAKVLKNYPNSILTSYIYNPLSNSHLSDYDKVYDGEKLNIRKILRMAPSPGLIFPMDIIQKSCSFDEEFGVGSIYGACEETDLILQAIDLGYNVLYSRFMEVKHPTTVHSFEIENNSWIHKKENYACGLGALIAKDICVRKSNRLKFFQIEKTIKLLIKSTGLVGDRKRIEAQAEWKGFNRGLKEYKK